MNQNCMDYITHLEDEIALEGLDGITLESLWVRLSLRHNFLDTLALDDNSKGFLWSLIVQDEEIDFYCLEESRTILKIFNRYEYMDAEMGIILEPEEDIEDIYPCSPVDDDKTGARGSCASYNIRKDVTNETILLSLPQVIDQYGHKLVLVASQTLRNKALCINAAIDKFYDLTLMQYIMLERIGRSRTMGEITYGKNSLAVMNVSPKTMFYHRKRLLKLNLITKQSHRQRSVKGNISSSSLLHLTRFYVIRKPKYIMIIQKVIEILRGRENNLCPLSQIKEEIGMPDISSKKIFKNAEFLKYIQTVMVPYRQIHKDATEKEWRYKVRNEEKNIRCLQLLNPQVTAEEIVMEEEEEEEEADEEENFTGILDQSNLVYGKSLMQQAYMVVEAAGPEGVSQIEMSKQLGQTKLDSRSICRNLQKRNVIHSLMKDIGRQRVSRYVSNRFASTGHLLQEFETERKKMMEIVEDSKREGTATEEENAIQYQASTPSTSRVMESDSAESVEIDLVVTHSGSKTAATVSEEKDTTSPAAVRRDVGLIVITPDGKSTPDDVGDAGVQYPVGTNIIDPHKSTYIHQKKVSPHLTTRMMKRANIIMNAVRTYKVIDDAFKLQKLIIDSEISEGSEAKMDKKSLTRLLDRLSRSGFLKKIMVKIKTETKVKMITFVVDSSITLESNLLKMAIEQQKHKFLVQIASSSSTSSSSPSLKKDTSTSSQGVTQAELSPGNLKREPSSEGGGEAKRKVKEDASVGESMLELEKMHNLLQGVASQPSPVKETPVQATKVVGVKGSVGPKFVRMQEFHKLLFYLVYGYEGKVDLHQEEAWKTLFEGSPHDLSNENQDDYPRIYTAEISWKMFIPPLPKHVAFSVTGWVFVVDLLLRLPLCIFVQIVNIVSQSSLLTTFLSHPIKQNLLVKNLPPELRRLLLNGRRYVNYVMELCRRLCYIGLLQQGRQVMKEKDQIFVYLNRNATLVDTTTSNPGYHHISLDKEYVRKGYAFYTIQDVIQYWYDMWTICMHTPLGGHMCVQGKKITIQMLSKKPEMIESLKAKSLEEAPSKDDGAIPGDERGAAGLDSAMFAHLKRNWSCLNARFTTVTQSPALTAGAEDGKAASSDRMFSYAQYLRNSCRPSSVESSVSKNRLAGLRNVRLSLYKPKRESEDVKPVVISVGLVDSKKRKMDATAQKEEAQKILRKPKRREKLSYQREIKARLKGPKKPYYDEEDKAALRRMNKLRVDWYPAEDSLLLLCKVSSAYLFPNKRTQIINFSVVRDLLHSRYPESRNKTSRACQRRINYILKNPATEENVAIILEELKQEEEITKKFKPAKLSHKLPVLHKLYVNVFKELVNRLVLKYASNESKEVPDLPDTYREFEDKFRIIRASNSLKQGPKLEEIASITDIDHYVVNALIFSSLCTKQDRESWAYQLYLAYQKYPQKLLNSVLSSIRESKMISYKKCYNRSKYTRTCLPLSTSPFQLSLSFIYMFHMKYQYDIFGDCWTITKMLLESKREALSKEAETVASKRTDQVQADAGETPAGTASELDEEPTAKKSKPEEEQPKNEPATKKKPRRRGWMRKIGKKSKSTKASREAKVKATKLAKERKKEEEGNPRSDMEVDGGRDLGEEEEEEEKEKEKEKKEKKEGNSHPRSTEPPGGDESQKEEPDTAGSFWEEKGVELSLNVRGGSCAAIMALVATKRLVFDILIPDQMILIDNNQVHDSPGPCNTLLEKVKNHELVSGRKFTLPDELSTATDGHSPDEDIYTDKNVTESGSNDDAVPGGGDTGGKAAVGAEVAVRNRVSFGREGRLRRLSSWNGAGGGGAEGRDPLALRDAAPRKYAPEKTQVYADMSDSSRRKRRLGGQNISIVDGIVTDPLDLGEGRKEVEVSRPKGRAPSSQSRIRMYMMREQMAEATEVCPSSPSAPPPSSSSSHWAFDNIFINTCEIWCRLRVPHVEGAVSLACTADVLTSFEELSKAFTPISHETINSALAVRKKVMLSDWTKLEPALGRWKAGGEPEEFLSLVKRIFEFVEAKKELGASAAQIKEVFPCERGCAFPAMKVLRRMEEVALVLKVGVDTFRWVTVQFAKTWLIHTNKMSRSKMNSSESVRLSGVYEVKETEKGQGKEGGERKRNREQMETASKEDGVTETENSTEEQPSTSSETKTSKGNVQNIRPRMALLKSRYRKDTEAVDNMEKALDQHLMISDHEEIEVLVRPWVRLNGCLNRRVMDRMLGAVLCYVMEWPGVAGFKVAAKFWPALQPAHTYELLETLVLIEAVKRFYVRKSHKVTLLSSSQALDMEPAEDFDYDDCMNYEAEVDCVLKLAMFIGDKKYTQDFLTNCR